MIKKGIILKQKTLVLVFILIWAFVLLPTINTLANNGNIDWIIIHRTLNGSVQQESIDPSQSGIPEIFMDEGGYLSVEIWQSGGSPSYTYAVWGYNTGDYFDYSTISNSHTFYLSNNNNRGQRYTVWVDNDDFDFRITEQSVDLADLIVEDIWTDPANPVEGESCGLYAKIKNIGDGIAENISLNYYVDGTYVDDDIHSSLNPGESRIEYESGYIFTSSGNHQYKVTIDPVTNEQVTNNNDRTETVNVEVGNSPPTISRISPNSPYTCNVGVNVIFKAELFEPDGEGDFDRVEWRVSGTLLYTGTYNSVTWSNPHTSIFNATFTNPGSYTVEAKVFDIEGEYNAVTWSVIAETMTYSITTSSNPSNGGTASGGGSYDDGTQCCVSATANTGYTFSHWEENGSNVSSSSSYCFTVSSNRNLVAIFTPIINSYTISTSSNPSNGGTTSGGGSYDNGVQCCVSATANTGYTFSHWEENGSNVSSNNPYCFSVSGDRSLVAVFTAISQPTITTSSSPSNGGTTSGGGSYDNGAQCCVSATANTGYTFSHWEENGSNVSSSSPYCFSVSGNRNLVAVFVDESTCIIQFQPSSQTVNTNTPLTTNLNIVNVQNLGGFELEISYDPTLLQATSISLGAFLESTGRTSMELANNIDNSNGLIEYAIATLGATPPGADGNGVLLTINWQSTSSLGQEMTADLVLQNVQVTQVNASATLVPTTLEDGTVTIVPNAVLSADFSANPIQGTAPLTVQFTDNSIGTPTSWAWDFDNDGTVDSNVEDPVWTYNQAGTYSVSLTISDGTNNSTKTEQDYINVLPSQNNGLVAYYPFNGNANDESGNGNDGNVVGPILVNDRFGNPNSAYQFDGSNDYIDCGNGSSINIAGQGAVITMSCWVKTNNAAVQQYLISKGRDYTTNRGYHIDIPNSKPRGLYRLSNNTNCAPQTIESIESGVWYHLASTYNGTIGKIYVNGVLTNSMTMPGEIGTSTTNLILGCHSPSPPTWYKLNGILDEVRIYDRVLSDTEILQLYQDSGELDAIFEADLTTGFAPLIVQFSDNSTGTPTSWAWDFDNDGTTDSNLEDPEWTYNEAGTYTVSLTVSDGTNSDTEVKTDYITVSQNQTEDLIFWEDFEDNALEPEITFSSVGTFNSPAGIKDRTEFGSTKAFGFGKSSCYSNCFTSFTTEFFINFSETTFVDSLVFKVMELDGDWGSSGSVYIDGEQVTGVYLGHIPSNSNQPDLIPRQIVVYPNSLVSEFWLYISDITQSSEIFIDDIEIYGTVGGSTNKLAYLRKGDPTTWTVEGVAQSQYKEIDIWTTYGGYTVDPLNLDNITLDENFLNEYSVIRINGLYAPTFTSDEILALENWVQSGGNLFAEIGFTNSVNLLEPYGVDNIIGQNGGSSGLAWTYHGSPWVYGPVTGPMSGVNNMAAEVMDVPVLLADNNLIVDAEIGGNPIVCHSNFGLGKVIIIFSINWSQDVAPPGNAYKANIYQQDNIQFVEQSIGYFQFDGLDAEFTANITQGNAPLTVQFTDNSVGTPTSWQWDFDNDGIIDSEEQNPQWSYDQAGTYTVSLTVSNGTNSYSEIKTDYITVNPSNNHFTPVWTGSPYQPMNVLISSSTIDGTAVNIGDEIGIFDVDGSGNDVCVGVGVVTQTITSSNPLAIVTSSDDPGTTEIDGFIAGNTINYKAWSSSIQEEYSTYQATYDPGFDNQFNPLGTSLSDVDFLSSITQNIDLTNGWNIMSFRVIPEDMDLLNILQPLVTSNELIKVIDEAGGFIQFIPGVGWMNTIGDMANTEGYYIKVTGNTAFDANGMAITLPFDIPLNTGWNIMSYPVDQSQNALTVLQPLIDNNELIKVIDEAGGFIQFIPGVGWMNTIVNFEEGEGYYIKLNANTTLTLNQARTSSTDVNIINIPQSKYFRSSFDNNPYFPMNIIITGIDLFGNAISSGDEVAVYDGDHCVGVGVVPEDIKQTVNIVASMDDPLTEDIDGYIENHNISFKYMSNAFTKPVDIYFEKTLGSDKFLPLGTFVGNLALSPNIIPDKKEGSDTFKLSVYPNPAMTRTNIEIDNYTEGNIRIEIINIYGKTVKLLCDEMMPEGKFDINYETSVLPAGIYNIRLIHKSRDGILQSHNKLVITK